MKRRLLFGLKAMVSVVLVGWVLHGALSRDGIDALFERIRALDPTFVAVALTLHFVAVFSGVLRWRLLLRARGLALPLPFLARSYLIGRFVGAFTPSTVGLDVYRAVDVARATGARGASASVIMVEKLVGLLGLSVVTAALVLFGAGALLGPRAVNLAVAVFVGASLGLVALRHPSRLAALARPLPARLRARVDHVLASVAAQHLGLADVSRALGLGIVSHLATAAVFVATAAALRVDADVLPLLVVGNAIIVATLLPISIGGVGVRESVAVVLLGSVGVSAADATLVALLGYLTGQAPALAGGALQMIRFQPVNDADSVVTSPGETLSPT